MQFLVVGAVALSTQAERLAALWKCLRDWYKTNKQPSMLDNLTKEMIVNDKKVKLRAKRTMKPGTHFCIFRVSWGSPLSSWATELPTKNLDAAKKTTK